MGRDRVPRTTSILKQQETDSGIAGGIVQTDLNKCNKNIILEEEVNDRVGGIPREGVGSDKGCRTRHENLQEELII